MSLLAGDVASAVDGQESPLPYKTVHTAGSAGIAANYGTRSVTTRVKRVATNALAWAEQRT